MFTLLLFWYSSSNGFTGVFNGKLELFDSGFDDTKPSKNVIWLGFLYLDSSWYF